MVENVVATYDNGTHAICKGHNGYYNKYNIKDGKARFTTNFVGNLPTAIAALKSKFPNVEEDVKES